MPLSHVCGVWRLIAQHGVLVQAHWRSRAARRRLAFLRAVVRTQARVRGALARRALAVRAEAAATLQAAWRRHSQQRQFLQLRSVTVQVTSCCAQQTFPGVDDPTPWEVAMVKGRE